MSFLLQEFLCPDTLPNIPVCQYLLYFRPKCAPLIDHGAVQATLYPQQTGGSTITTVQDFRRKHFIFTMRRTGSSLSTCVKIQQWNKRRLWDTPSCNKSLVILTYTFPMQIKCLFEGCIFWKCLLSVYICHWYLYCTSI